MRPPPRPDPIAANSVSAGSLIWGTLALAAATALAAFLLRQGDPAPRVLALLAFALTAAVLVPAAHDCAQHGLAALLKPQHLAGFGVAYWLLLDLVQSLYHIPLEGPEVFAGFGAIALFAFAALAGSYGQPRPASWAVRLRTIRLSANSLFAVSLACFTIGLVFYLFRADWSLSAVLAAMLRGRWNTPWSRGPLGDTWAALEILAYFGYILPTLLVLQIRASLNKFSPQVLSSAAMALFFVGLIATDGSRRSVGVVILAALLCWVLTAHPRKAILSGLAGIAALLIALNVLLATRGNWTAGVEITKSSFSAVRVDDNFLRLCQTIKAVPADAPYSGWMPVIFAAVRPIPRALWPEKPTSPGFTIHDYLGYRGVSLSMSAVGELYTCAGFLSVVLGGFVYGSLCKWLAGLLCLERTAGVVAVYALSYAALFVGIRSMIDLVLFSYPLAAAVVLIKVFSVLHDAHRN